MSVKKTSNIVGIVTVPSVEDENEFPELGPLFHVDHNVSLVVENFWSLFLDLHVEGADLIGRVGGDVFKGNHLSQSEACPLTRLFSCILYPMENTSSVATELWRLFTPVHKFVNCI